MEYRCLRTNGYIVAPPENKFVMSNPNHEIITFVIKRVLVKFKVNKTLHFANGWNIDV